MSELNHKMNFRYRFKINEVNYNIQLFNIQQEKIKIMIDTKSSYSDDYIEYSNIYTLIQFQEISKYYKLFENIEEIFEDLSHTIQTKNFSISHNGNTMSLILKLIINEIETDVEFILDKSKTIDLSNQIIDNPYLNNNTSSYKYSEINKSIPFTLEKSKRNINISNLDELKYLLTDLKDRITVLEASQYNIQNSYQNNNQDNNQFNIQDNNQNNNLDIYGNNNDINYKVNNIIMRLNKLENEKNEKDKIIEDLENKLKYYESINDNNINIEKNNNNFNNINNNILNSVPTYPNNDNLKNKLFYSLNYNNYRLQTQRQSTLTYNSKDYFNNNNFNNNINKNKNYINDNNRRNYYNYKLKQSKSEIFKNNKINSINENISLHSRDTKKFSNLRNNYSYNDKKISFRDNNSYNDKKISFRDNNQSFTEKNTFRSNKISNSYTNEANSSYLRTNNSNVNSINSKFSNAKDKNFQKYVVYKEKLGIPIVPRDDNLKKYVNSRIIFTINELKLLKLKLLGGDKNMHVFFDLLYRASMDGDYEEIVKDNIVNKEKTLTLFYTYEGSRFGAYINKKKGKSFLKGITYKEVPGSSFIVSLNNLKIFDISPNKTSKEGHEDYLSFGRTYYLNANGSNWLIYTPKSHFLKKRCIIGNQQGEYLDFEPSLLVGKKNEYHLKDVEIFDVVYEKDDKN